MGSTTPDPKPEESSVVAFVRENPVPLSLIGLGLGLLVWNSRRNARNRRGPDPSVVGRSAVYEGLDGDDGHSSTGRPLQQVGERLRDGARKTFEEQPLALGALALGAGLAIGLTIPATESENQLVGEYRDRLFGSAKPRAAGLEGMAESALPTAQSAEE